MLLPFSKREERRREVMCVYNAVAPRVLSLKFHKESLLAKRFVPAEKQPTGGSFLTASDLMTTH